MPSTPQRDGRFLVWYTLGVDVDFDEDEILPGPHGPAIAAARQAYGVMKDPHETAATVVSVNDSETGTTLTIDLEDENDPVVLEVDDRRERERQLEAAREARFYELLESHEFRAPVFATDHFRHVGSNCEVVTKHGDPERPDVGRFRVYFKAGTAEPVSITANVPFRTPVEA